MYCSGVSQTSKRLDSRSLGLSHLGHSFRVGLLRFVLLSTSRKFLSMPMFFALPLVIELQRFLLSIQVQQGRTALSVGDLLGA